MPEAIRIITVGCAGILLGIVFGYIEGYDRGYKKGYKWACKKEIAKADMEDKNVKI